jgi:hypothetical protein
VWPLLAPGTPVDAALRAMEAAGSYYIRIKWACYACDKVERYELVAPQLAPGVLAKAFALCGRLAYRPTIPRCKRGTSPPPT